MTIPTMNQETLLQNGWVIPFDDSMGNAMFVSHQWAASEHPDPSMEQFRVLQDALRNIMPLGLSRMALIGHFMRECTQK